MVVDQICEQAAGSRYLGYTSSPERHWEPKQIRGVHERYYLWLKNCLIVRPAKIQIRLED